MLAGPPTGHARASAPATSWSDGRARCRRLACARVWPGLLRPPAGASPSWCVGYTEGRSARSNSHRLPRAPRSPMRGPRNCGRPRSDSGRPAPCLPIGTVGRSPLNPQRASPKMCAILSARNEQFSVAIDIRLGWSIPPVSKGPSGPDAGYGKATARDLVRVDRPSPGGPGALHATRPK